jgi:iron only hydrogenase large subunit-like protein
LNFVEKSNPDDIADNISTTKSPHMMYGAVVKEFRKELFGREKVYLTSIMPCIKKRGESDRSCFVREDGQRDVDNVITTKDLGQLLRLKGIDPTTLKPEKFDSPFQNSDGAGTGAGQLFGATGGVMEAAVRSVYELVVGKELPRIEFDEVRGLDGVKEATLSLFDEETGKGMQQELRIAVVNGLGNTKQLIKKLADGEVQYDFVEVMACPGGCINGGGQPRSGDIQARMDTIYQLDRTSPRRKSHENPIVAELYAQFMEGEYGGKTAHRLLHVKPIYGDNGSNNDSKSLNP